MDVLVHPGIGNGRKCEHGYCEAPARVVVATAWKTDKMGCQGSVEIQTRCERHAEMQRQLWKGSREAQVVVFPATV